MAGRWYYRQGTAEFGPVALPQLVQLARAGQIAVTDWARQGETSPWQPVARIPELMAVFGASRASAAPAPQSAAPAPLPLTAKAPAPRPAPHQSGSYAPIPQASAPAPRPLARGARPAPAPLPAPARSPAPQPVAVASAPGSSVRERHPRKSSSATAITLGLCGAAGVLVTIVVVILASSGGSTAAPAPVASAPETPKAEEAGAPAAGVQQAALQASMTRAIRNWRDASVKGGLKGLISFEVKGVAWIDAPSAAATEGQPGRLRVEVAVTNTATTPLAFSSWSARGKSGAWLVDDKLEFISSASGSGPVHELAPQQTITESLEFATSRQDFDELRLVLPYAAVERSGQWGYILPGPLLRGETSQQPEAVAKTPAEKPAPEPAPAKPSEPLVIQAPDDTEVPGIAANQEPMVDDGEPKEDIRDLIKKSFEGNK